MAPPLDAQTASDSLLCDRAGSGDNTAFQILIQRYAPLMRAYAIRLLGGTSDADDVIQETLIKAWKKIDTVQEPSKVKSWLMTLTNRTAIDHIRSRKVTSELDEVLESADNSISPEQNAIQGSQLGALNELLRRLPAEQSQVWTMREVGGFSYKEIAQTLQISEASVRGRLARARGTLIDGMDAWK
ncbi:RNA polymerase sigma factor [Rothia aerolata]|uniref:RNA polymerase sigma factor n=1 Tax=Rothia aerolata TaxID=1812262 RepID=A0A917ISK0_9MICC|nr:RNA polymerase sigma factor [Rothia aerolata]GGH62196.1 putative RNA polymerase sigma factor [Rothia aerolata]